MRCLLNVIVQRGAAKKNNERETRAACLRPLLKAVEHNASDDFFHHP
ncbi:hypothetical protein [Paraburkholderia sp.]